MIKETFLDDIRNGTATSVSPHGSNAVRSLGQEDLDILGEAMQQGKSIDYIALPNAIMGARDLAGFAAGIQACANLQHLDLSRNTITQESAGVLADALRGHTELSSINLTNCKLDGQGAAVLFDALSECPNLREIKGASNDIGSQGAEALGRAMGGLPLLESLTLTNCGFEVDDLRHIASAMPDCRRLTTLDCTAENLMEEGGKVLLEGVMKRGNPNLTTIFPSCSELESKSCRPNFERAKEISRTLIACDGDYSQLSAPEIGTSYDLLPVINKFNGNKTPAVKQFEQYINDMPRVDNLDTVTLADITREGDQHHSALSNPRTWQRLPKVLQKLEASGESLTLDTLLEKNKDGSTHLETALATAPDIVIPALNKHGVQLGAKILLQDGAQPTKALELIISRHAGPDLFTLDNWKGANPTDAKRAFETLPQEQKNLIGGISGMCARMRQQNQQDEAICR